MRYFEHLNPKSIVGYTIDRKQFQLQSDQKVPRINQSIDTHADNERKLKFIKKVHNY